MNALHSPRTSTTGASFRRMTASTSVRRHKEVAGVKLLRFRPEEPRLVCTEYSAAGAFIRRCFQFGPIQHLHQLRHPALQRIRQPHQRRQGRHLCAALEVTDRRDGS